MKSCAPVTEDFYLQVLYKHIAESGRTIKSVAGEVGMSERALVRRMNNEIKLSGAEAFRLRNAVAPAMPIEELFAELF